MLEFRGIAAQFRFGGLVMRELGDASGCPDLASAAARYSLWQEHLSIGLDGLFRQSVLAAGRYEDVNDANQLRLVIRSCRVVGAERSMHSGPGTQMGRFETETLALAGTVPRWLT
ncbi:MAG: hypothetical protein H6871_08520 [Methylobacteriaceae bacterium]|nr:hypothetical protein [Methylobacteriaceae bacterium]